MPRASKKADGKNEVANQLLAFRLEKDLSYTKLALLIGGVSGVTVMRAERGESLNARTNFKLKRFLEGVTAHA